MAEVPPDWRAPVPQTPAMSSRRSGDALVACLLLLLQPLLIYITWFVVGFRAMAVGACAYEGCGHQAWLDRVMALLTWGGVIVLVAAAVWTQLRYLRHRGVWFVPLIGYAAQVGLAVVCWAIFAAGSH